MSDKLITLITGANQGIGYYAAQQFAASGQYHVLVGSRDRAKGEKAVAAIVADAEADVREEDIAALQIDVDDDASIDRAVETVRREYGRLDILINNAGISHGPGSDDGATPPTTTTALRQEYQSIYNTNVFGAAVCTEAFIPLLRASTRQGGKRIVFVSSGLSSLGVATTQGDGAVPADVYAVYRSSKTAGNMVMAGWAARLGPEGFVVGAACPGYCGTNLNGYAGSKDARAGAGILRAAVEGTKGEVGTRIIHADGEGGRRGVYPW